MANDIDYWNDQAATFDESADHGLRDPRTRQAWGSLLRPRLPPAPARVADMGCGTGSLSVLLAEAGHQVNGIDSAATMVDAAQAKAMAAGVEITLDVGDAGNPPWPTRTFDVVIARHVVWALPDPERALGRWADLLMRDGRLLLIEGHWSTGAGIAAKDLLSLLQPRFQNTSVTQLDDPDLWRGPIHDERYLLTATLGAGKP